MVGFLFMDNSEMLKMIRDRDDLLRHVKGILDARERRILPRDNLRASAVLVPLSWKENEPSVIVTKRSMTVEHHKGEISFPGGRAEETDRDIFFTALREAEEEIGLKPDDVDVIGLLDDHISIMGYHITPVVGAVPYPYHFSINSESETILCVPLAAALSETAWMGERTTFMGQGITIYYLEIDGGVVWGATGRMLKHFADLIAGRPLPFSKVTPEAKAWVTDLLAVQTGLYGKG